MLVALTFAPWDPASADEAGAGAVVRVLAVHGTGTAFAIGEDLYVTARHVVAESPWVRLDNGGPSVPAQVVARDPGDDIAVVRAAEDLSSEPLALRGSAIRSASVTALGHPRGGDLVSLEGQITGVTATAIRSTVAAQPGMSGGPLLDADGDVVGVLVAVSPSTGTLAVPSRRILDALDAARITPPAAPGGTGASMPAEAVLLLVVALGAILLRRSASHEWRELSIPQAFGGRPDEVVIDLGPVRTVHTNPTQE